MFVKLIEGGNDTSFNHDTTGDELSQSESALLQEVGYSGFSCYHAMSNEFNDCLLVSISSDCLAIGLGDRAICYPRYRR